MTGTKTARPIQWLCNAIALSILVFGFSVAQASDVTTAYKDENGWKLQVNGDDYYIKGVVWGYSPRGQNYSYNLWGESDDFIRKVLDLSLIHISEPTRH